MPEDAIYSYIIKIYSIIFSARNLSLFLFITSFSLFAFFILNRRSVFSKNAIKNTITTLITIIINALMVPIIYYACISAEIIYNFLHIPKIPTEFWAGTHWSILIILSVISVDCANYWNHRFMHTKIGWPTHMVHHSDSHVNGFTTFRVHFLEVIVMQISYIVLLSWMGINAGTVIFVSILCSLHNAYVHFEIDIDHGRLNWLIASPRFHRWHHADAPEVYGKNLANIMPIWDVIFGTYYKGGQCNAPMGALKDGIPDTDIVKLILMPLQLYCRQLFSLFQSKARISK
jgi:sterol desaturase/sphingolipid hydroxylase (fatty acid hydroxylase superfamily)